MYIQADNVVAYIFLVPTIVSEGLHGIMNQILRALKGLLLSNFSVFLDDYYELISIYKRLQAFEAAINDQPLTGIDKEFIDLIYRDPNLKHFV